MEITKILSIYAGIVSSAAFAWNVYQYYDKKGKVKIIFKYQREYDKINEEVIVRIKCIAFSIVNLTERKKIIDKIQLMITKADSFDKKNYDKYWLLKLFKVIRIFKVTTAIGVRLNEGIIQLEPNEPFCFEISSDYINKLIYSESEYLSEYLKAEVHKIKLRLIDITGQSFQTDFITYSHILSYEIRENYSALSDDYNDL